MLASADRRPTRRPHPRTDLRAILIAALIGCLAVLAGPPAYADPQAEADAAIAAFQDGVRVYVAPSAGQQVDTEAVTDAIGDPPVYIAVLGPNVSPDDALFAAAGVLSGDYTVVAISGTDYAVESTAYCAEQAVQLLDDTAQADGQGRLGGDLTEWLTTYVTNVGDLDPAGSAACADSGLGGDSSSTGILWWLLGALVLVTGVAYLWLRARGRKHDAQLADQRAGVGQLLARLGGEIDQAQPSRDQIALQALTDAAARHDAAVDALDSAEGEDDISAARQAVIEGLTASRLARERAGQPTTSVPPLPPPYGERLEDTQEIEVAGETVVGYPRYTPGAPHYHRGGGGFSAGWYTAPVWDGAIIGAVLGPHTGEIPLPGEDERR